MIRFDLDFEFEFSVSVFFILLFILFFDGLNLEEIETGEEKLEEILREIFGENSV